MNEQISANSEDLVIDLGDLLFFLLKKWRVLLALLLAGAILGTGVGIGKACADPEPTQEELQALEDAMPVLEQALRYRQVYEQILNYQEGSPTMHMDPNCVYTGKVVYSIQADNQLDAITAQYSGLLDNKLSHQLLEASGMDFEVQYINELVSCWSYSQNRENSTSEDMTSTVDCMAYQVKAASQEHCDAMLEVFRKAVAQLDQTLDQAYPGYSAQKISDTIVQADPNSYITHRESQASRLNSSRSNMQTLENSFSGYTAKYYFEEMVGLEPEEHAESPLKSILKWGIVGAFLAGVCWGGWYLAAYLACGKIRTSEEVSESYRIALLGRVCQPKNFPNPIDRLLDDLHQRIRKKPDTPVFIASVIGAMAPGSIALCAEAADDPVQATLTKCSSRLVPLPYPGTDEGSLAQVRGLGQAVLLVRPGFTARRALRQQIELCRLQKITILGIVSVE